MNAQLTSIGTDAQGQERFFISCLSGAAGAVSFLLSEDGESRSYAWPGLQYVYSVAPETADVVWLGGGGAFSRLTLCSGEQEVYPLKELGFITAGMAFDAETGKLFGGAQFALVSFDTRTSRLVRVYTSAAERSPDNFHFAHWRLPDGSYGFMQETPGISYLRWDPKNETVVWRRLTDDCHHPAMGLFRRFAYKENGRVYLPHFGWLDGITGTITPHERPPDQEAGWFGRRDDTVYGVRNDTLNALATVVAWNLASGKTTPLFTVPEFLLLAAPVSPTVRRPSRSMTAPVP